MGMRAAYARGDNAMAWARANSSGEGNSIASALIAYDLQAGSYVTWARENFHYNVKWCTQLAELIQPYLATGDSVMEVGVGEATTLAGVMKSINRPDLATLGFDVSWSRIRVAQEWVMENSVSARLFVGDLFHIPLANNSIDVIYTAHSLEPNGGREVAAIAELLRVARKAVVLVEPIYELASEFGQKRMAENGYVRGLKSTAEQLGAIVVDYRLLEVCDGPHNPSGVVCMVKPNSQTGNAKQGWCWQCPMTSAPLVDLGDVFYAKQVGIAYPVMRGVPLLRAEHAVVASKVDG